MLDAEMILPVCRQFYVFHFDPSLTYCLYALLDPFFSVRHPIDHPVVIVLMHASAMPFTMLSWELNAFSFIRICTNLRDCGSALHVWAKQRA